MTLNMDSPCFPPCPERQDAIDDGRIYWNTVHKGWVDREMPWRTRTEYWVDYTNCTKRKRVVPVGKPYTLGACPYCGRNLPDPLEEHVMSGFEYR